MTVTASLDTPCKRPNCEHPLREHEKHYQSIERKFHTPCQMAACYCPDYVLSLEPEVKK